MAHCDVTKKLSHAWAGINRSQTPGACLGHPGVRDKTILQLSYLHNGISYTGKTTSLYWIGALVIIRHDIDLVCLPIQFSNMVKYSWYSVLLQHTQILHDIAYSLTMTKVEHRLDSHSQYRPYTLLSQASYGMSIRSILEKIYHVIMGIMIGPHCAYTQSKI